MVVRKIIERILEEGQTSITITDTDIPGSLIRTYSNDPDLMPVQIVLTGSTLKIDYEAQTSDKYVAVELVKQGLDIIDNLTSTDADAALSAKQGKELKDLVDGITPITELTELDDVSADDPQTGDILKYNGASEKWEKYNLPDIPSYLGDLGDVVLDTVTTGQVLTYNGAYWTNATPSSGGDIVYSLNEKVIGQWVDGSTLYEKTILIPSVATGTTYAHSISNVDKIWVQDIKATRNSTWFTSGHVFEDASNNIAESFSVIASNTYLFTYLYGCTITDCYVTVRYTKL